MYVQVLFNKILITRTSNKKINILWILKYVIEAGFVLGYSPRKYTTYYEKEKRKIRYRQIVQLSNSTMLLQEVVFVRYRTVPYKNCGHRNICSGLISRKRMLIPVQVHISYEIYQLYEVNLWNENVRFSEEKGKNKSILQYGTVQIIR